MACLKFIVLFPEDLFCWGNSLLDCLLSCGGGITAGWIRRGRVRLSRFLLLQLLRRDVIGREIEARFYRFVRRLIVQLLDFEIRDRNNPLIVRHLIEEAAQPGERTLDRNIDLLATVEVLLDIILRREVS